MPEFKNSVLYYIVPKFKSNKHTVTIPSDETNDLEYIKISPRQGIRSSFTGPTVSFINIERINGDGSIEKVPAGMTKDHGAFMDEYINDNNIYFHFLSCVLNGNCKKINEEQFKEERIRRI